MGKLAKQVLRKPKTKSISTKDELQLVALNERLRSCITRLEQRSDELANLSNGAGIPILILDRDRRIRLFTPPSGKLLGLVPTDVGRPIGNLWLGVLVPDLEELISTVVAKAIDVRREVRSPGGHWYAFHLRPFVTGENKTDGVVMAFEDIQDFKQRQKLQKNRDFLSTVLDAAKDLLVMILDREGRIVHFNRVCRQLTGYSLKEAKGRRVWDFLLLPEEVAPAQETFRQALAGTPIQRENHWVARDGRRLLISWSHTVAISDGEVQSVIRTGIDVTAREDMAQRAQESEATVLALLESAAQAILAHDKDGRIVLANAMAEKMYGYRREDLIGQRMESLIPERFRNEYALHLASWFREPRDRPMGIGSSLVGRRKDGSEFPIEVSLSHVDTREGALGVAFIADITERKHNERTMLEYQQKLQTLTSGLIAAQESRNRELARELHDVFSQDLAALGMGISSLKEESRSDPDLVARLSDLGNKITRVATDMHRTSRKLHPAIVEELGIEAALRQECEAFQKQSNIPVQFTSEDAPAKLSSAVALCLYRIAQESLRNIQKHSPGTDAVRMSLAGSPQGVTLRIEDTGDGFDPDEASKKGGLGLISMEERIRLVKGKLTIQSQPGKGTMVAAFVPLKNIPREKL